MLAACAPPTTGATSLDAATPTGLGAVTDQDDDAPTSDDGFVADVDQVEAAPEPATSGPTSGPEAVAAAPSTEDVTRALADGAPVMQDLARRAAATARADAAEPAHLRIPAIGVDTPTIDLDLTAVAAEVPESFDIAGWYRQTRTPGTVGPAVIVGHVGSRAGPGVFARLDQLRAGDQIHVTDDDGTTRTFVVERGGLVDKYDRPPDVFGWIDDRPELRLITCGGDFDPGTGHHVSNYVVWAHEA